MLTGGTDVHLVLVDLRNSEIDGQQAEDLLHEVGITVNRNAVPFDPRPPMVTSGLRIGTPALATRGFGDAEFTEVADIIALALQRQGGCRRAALARRGAHGGVPALPGPAAVGRRMTAITLDGVATASAVKAELVSRVVALRGHGVVPGLGTLLVGDDPGSRAYVAGKHRDCAEVGIESIRVDLPATATEAEVAGGDRATSTPTRDVTGLHRAAAAAGGPSTRTRCSSSSTPTRTPTACTRRTSGASCSGSRASCTRRCRARRPASSSCCGGTTCRSRAGTWS